MAERDGGRSAMTRRGLFQRALALGAVGVGADLLAACTAQVPPAASGAATAAASAAKSRVPSGQLRVAIPLGAGNELGLPSLGSPSNKPHWDLFYDYLLKVDPKSGQLQPGLASAWQMSPDGKTWTFKLRENVPFHKDQGLFSADDVKFTLETIVAAAKVTVIANQNTLRDKLDGVTVTDPQTVVVQLKEPWPGFGYHVANYGITGTVMTSKKYVGSVGIDKAAQDIVGTGPFEYVGRSNGAWMKGRAFAKYWGTPPGVAEVTLNWIPEESTRLASLLAGENEITTLPRSLMSAPLKQGFKKVSTPVGAITVYMILGGQYPGQPTYDPSFPWNKAEVRQALNLAINRDEIRSKIFGGDGEPLGVSMYPPGMPGYKPDWKPRPFDPTKAKQLLAQGGSPNGFEADAWSFLLSGVPEMMDMTEAVTNYWKAIGVRMNIKAQPLANINPLNTAYKTTGIAYPMRIIPVTTYDVITQFPVFLFPGAAHHHQWQDPDIEKLAVSTFAQDTDQRVKTMQSIFQREYDEYRTVPIISLPVSYVANARVEEWDLQDTYGLDLHTVRLKS